MKFNEGNIFLEFPEFELFGFEIGPISIAWYAILILTGAMAALVLGIIEGKKVGIDKEFLTDLVFYGIPLSVIGARIYYVIFSWDYYKDNPIDALKIYEGGLAIHGAVITAVIWGAFFCRYKKVNFLRTIDLGAPGFLIAQAIGRWGNFMNQEAHGGKVPGETIEAQREFLEKMGIPNFIVDKMYIEGVYNHPTFFYESLWNILGLTFMMLLKRTKYLYDGDLGLIYLMWYSLGRGIIEGMRTDSLYIGNTGIRIAQLISAILFILGALVLIFRHYERPIMGIKQKLMKKIKGNN